MCPRHIGSNPVLHLAVEADFNTDRSLPPATKLTHRNILISLSGRSIGVKERGERHRIGSHRIASHRIASHRIASHRIASHRIASQQQRVSNPYTVHVDVGVDVDVQMAFTHQ